MTDTGHVVLTFMFTRPTVDGNGYTITLRGFNATCAIPCTAKSGMMADVVSQEDMFDWGAELVLSWNGK